MTRLASIMRSNTPSTTSSSDSDTITNLDDVCSLPDLDKSNTEGSDSSTISDDQLPPLGGGVTPTRPRRYLRQRGSGLNNSDSGMAYGASASDGQPTASTKETSNSGATLSSDFIPQFLLPHNTNAPIPKGPGRVRKDSDFDKATYSGLEVEYDGKPCKAEMDWEPEPDKRGIGRIRSREEIVLQFMVFINMLWRDSGLILFGLVFQYVHNIMTNIAYYYHTQLTAAQRVPLRDVAYENLPVLKGQWWMVSEYLVYGMLGAMVFFCLSTLFIRWNPPHGRPIYTAPIGRRLLMSLTCCQVLRCISFLVTTLPGASHQCLYQVPSDMTAEEMLQGPAHDRGNPMGWAPPLTVNDIIWKLDPTTGCGDLMFSSHTIFTMSFVCIVWKYFNWGILKWGMVIVQLIIVPFILAAHKHYSIDVFTALYVTPLVFEVLWIYFPDMDLQSTTMASHYGIRFTKSYQHLNQDKAAVVMCMRGGEFFVDPLDLPLDLRRAYFGRDKLGHDDDNVFEDDSGIPNEFAPFDV